METNFVATRVEIDDYGEALPRMESYLEEDSPAKQGANMILCPPENLFTIPGHEISVETIKQVPKYPRSELLKDEMRKTIKNKNLQDEQDKMRIIQERLKVKKVKEARENMVRKGLTDSVPKAEKRETHRSKSHFRHKYMEPKRAASKGPSISSTARQYLHTQSLGTGKVGRSQAEKVLVEKVEVIRNEVLGGGTTLEHLRVPHHLPKNPKPSAVRHVDIVVEQHRSPQELEEEREQTMQRWRAMTFLKGTLAASFLRGTNDKFSNIILVHRYERNEDAMTKIVRLQRWVRHVRLKWVFQHLLKKRRVVYKAVGWWMIGARLRYRRLCGTRIRAFFSACFNEGGFRMAMKIFLFRVIKLQRCIRSFLACLRARISTLCLKMKATPSLVADGRFAVRTSGVIRYIIEQDQYAVNRIIKKYRKPFINQLSEYRRAIKAGDMTPAFQELDFQKISAFLKASTVKEIPPQYEGDTIRKPILFLYSRIFLHEDFSDVIEEMLPAYLAYEKQRALEEAERKEKKAMDDAIARGEGQAYQLKKMQEKMKLMGNPQDRYEEGVAELKEFFRARKKEYENELKQAATEKRARKTALL